MILHCVAHHLELAVFDAVKTIPYLETFDETIRQVFKFYYYSPKKRREVNAVSEILNENPAHFSSNIKKTRWLSSRRRALAAMEKNLAVTVTHLEQVSSGKGEDAAKTETILKQITTGKFARSLSIIQCHLGYATQVWSPQSIGLLKRVENVQHRATKLILKLLFPCDVTYKTRLQLTNLLPTSYWHEFLDSLSIKLSIT